jgi:hypothetical protein
MTCMQKHDSVLLGGVTNRTSSLSQTLRSEAKQVSQLRGCVCGANRPGTLRDTPTILSLPLPFSSHARPYTFTCCARYTTLFCLIIPYITIYYITMHLFEWCFVPSHIHNSGKACWSSVGNNFFAVFILHQLSSFSLPFNYLYLIPSFLRCNSE